jgi:hypothetical protein
VFHWGFDDFLLIALAWYSWKKYSRKYNWILPRIELFNSRRALSIRDPGICPSVVNAALTETIE